MKSLVVYHSQFGNTKTLAETIGQSLQAFGPVRVTSIDGPGATDLEDVDLLVIGGPTQAHGSSPPMRSFLKALKTKTVAGFKGATFDTRLKGPEFFTGSAAKGMANTLQHVGVTLASPPESFLVAGKVPLLLEGEIERAKTWAASLGQVVGATAAMVGG